MTTQYSPILKLALPVQGELSGTWGDVVNDNITSMVEQAIAGRAVINTWSTNSHTLTSANGTTSESRCAMLELTDTNTELSGAGTVVCPALSKIYIVKNAAGQNITVKTASGTGILIPDGRTTFLFCDGTNVVEALTHTTSLQLGTSTTVTAVLDEDNMASNSATSLATQQSIKAYVDSKVGQFDSLAEVLAVGNTTGSNNIIVDNGQKITTNTIDETTAGSGVTIDSVLLKDDGVNATNLEVTNIKANDGTAAGSIADSTGVVTVASAVLTTADINGGTADGVVIGGTTPAAATATTVTANTSLNIAGTTTVTSILDEDNMASDDPAGLATQQSIKAYVDAQVGTVDTLAEVLANGNTTGGNDIVFSAGDNITNASGNLTIDVAGELIIDADSSSIVRLKDAGTEIGIFYGTSSDFYIKSQAVDKDLIFQGNDNGSTITALTLDMSAAGAATFNAGVTLTGTLNVDSSSTNGFLSAGSNILNFGTSSNDTVAFYANNTEHMKLKPDGEVILNETGGAEGDFRVESDNSSHALFVDAGNNRVGINKSAPARVLHVGGESEFDGTIVIDKADGTAVQVIGTSNNTGYLNWESNGWTFYTNGPVEALRLGSSEMVVNEDSRDYDFRVESDGNSNMFTVNAGNNRVGVGTLNGLHTLSVFETGTALGGQGHFSIGTGALAYQTTVFRLDANNNFAIDQNYASVDRNRLFIERSTGYIGVGTESPDSMITVKNTGTNMRALRVYSSGSAAVIDLGVGTGQTNGNDAYLALRNQNAADVITLSTNGVTVFNENGDATNDFRVESDTRSAMLFVDASTDRVGINTDAPQQTLEVRGKVLIEANNSGATSIPGNQLILSDSDTSIDANQLMGQIAFNTADLTNPGTAAKIQTRATNSLGSGELQIWSGTPGGINKNVHFRGDQVVFNEDSEDMDFRVESNSNSNIFFIDAEFDSGQGAIGIGTGSPQRASGFGGSQSVLQITGCSVPELRLTSSTSGQADLSIYAGNSGATAKITNLNGAIELSRGGSNQLTVSNGVVINEDGNDYDFRVESDTQANMLFVDASENTVIVNGNTAVGDGTSNSSFVSRGVVSTGSIESPFFVGYSSTGIGDGFIMTSTDQTSYLTAASFNDYVSDYETTFVIRVHPNSTPGNYVESMRFGNTSVVVNEQSRDCDFRVESDSVSDMFVVDAGANCVNIGAVGSTTTNYSLFVRGNNAESGTNTYYVQKIGASNYSDAGQYTALIGLGVEPNAAWSKGAIGWRRSASYDRGDMVFLVNNATNTSTASNSDERMRINSAGVVITGNLAKSSGSFRIDHPLPEKSATHNLVHSFVEAPQADNIYRGKIDLVAGQATANIDTVAGMTDGTFAALNREIQCFTSNETGWTAVRGSVSGNILTIEAQDNTCTDTVSWLVVGERQDQHMYDTEWTDENGKVIVEPLKPVE